MADIEDGHIVKWRHAAGAFSGAGARQFGGRWTIKGSARVYTAGSAALAALELPAHLDGYALLGEFVLIEARFDGALVEELHTRRYMLLQNAAFLPMFRQAMAGRGQLADRRIDRLTAVDNPGSQEGVDAILAEISRAPMTATGKVLGYLSSGGKAEDLMRAARGVLLLKANDSHDYKFTCAAFEDFGSISAPWRDRFLAAGVLRLRGSQERTNPLVRRIREAFA